MTATTFKRAPVRGRMAYESSAWIGGNTSLAVTGSAPLDEVSVSRTDGATYLSLRLSAEQARALAHELLAAADAVKEEADGAT